MINQSAIDALGVTMTLTRISSRSGDWKPGSRHWRIGLERTPEGAAQPEKMIVTFSQGSAHTEAPTLGDVLESLAIDWQAAQLSFDEFFSELGYSVPSVAQETYDLCLAEAADLVRLFPDLTPDQLSELLEE